MSDPQQQPTSTGTIADSFEALPTFTAPKVTASPIRPAPTFSELYQAGHDVARNDRSDFESDMLRDGYRPIIDALGNDTKWRRQSYMGREYDAHILNPGDLIDEGQRTQYGAIASRADMEEAIAAKIRAHRASNPEFLKGIPDTVPELRKYFAANEKARRDKGQAVLDRGQGFTAGAVGFAGQGAEAFHDPLNVATLPIGGGGKTVLQIIGREILVNAGLEALQQPIVAQNREMIGEELTAGEAATNVVTAGLFGGLLEGGVHGGAKVAGAAYDFALPHLFNAMPEGVQRAWADKMALGIAVPGGEIRVPLTDALAPVPTLDVVDGARTLINPVRMTPEERAIMNVLERDAEISASSPFKPGMAGDQAHTTNLAEAINALIADKPAAEPAIPVGPITGSGAGKPAPAPGRPLEAPSTAFERPPTGNIVQGEAAISSFINKTRRAESGGNDRAANPRSSAEGRFQFTDDTFVDYYHKVIDAGASRGEALAHKYDANVQERLMGALTHDNAAALTRAGIPVTEGNLYLAHFLGSSGAIKVLKADPSRPVSSLLPSSFLTANPEVLGRGQSASEVAAWASRKMGGKAGSVPAAGALGDFAEIAGDQTIAQLKAQANAYTQQAIGETLLPGGGRIPIAVGTFRPGDILVDANRFQFKGGGDEHGVTDRLRGITHWDPVFAGRVMVWQDKEGKHWLADGHQRHGLATRLEAEHGGNIPLEAFVLREADGVSAADARVYAALKNIGEGTGTAIDAAKVVRDAGDHVLSHLPPRSALVRDGRALAALSDHAFGAVYNELIPADIAAVIGHILPDRPDAHEAMIDLLIKLDPANRGQAESIVRQAVAAGMHKEEQIGLFGAEEITTSHFLERAKVLERGLARIRNLKGAFKAATVHASTLEAKGSKIARDRTAEEAKAYAEAAEIISRVAFSRDNPVNDALNDAARELAGGAKLGDVVTRFVDRVADVDLGALSRAVAGDDAARLAPDGAGRGGDALGEGEAVSAEQGDRGQPSLLELEAATERFSDPDGAAVKQQADSLEHDFKIDAETRRALLHDQLRHGVAAFEAFVSGADHGEFNGFRWEWKEDPDGLPYVAIYDGEQPGAHTFDVPDLLNRVSLLMDEFTPEELGISASHLADLKNAAYAKRDAPIAEAVAAQRAFVAEAADTAAGRAGKAYVDNFGAGGEWPQWQAAFIRGARGEAVKFGPNEVLEQRAHKAGKKWAERLGKKGSGPGDFYQQPASMKPGKEGMAAARENDASSPFKLGKGNDAREFALGYEAAMAGKTAEGWELPVWRMGYDRAVNRVNHHVRSMLTEQPLGAMVAPLVDKTRHAFEAGDAAAASKAQVLADRFEAIARAADHAPYGRPLDAGAKAWLAERAHPEFGDLSAADADLAERLGRGAAVLAARDKTTRVDLVEGADMVTQLRQLEAPAPDRKGELLGGAAAIDPGIAARQRQEADLRAQSPMRPGAVDAEGTMGLGLFDAADQPGLDLHGMTFRLDEDGGEISAADLLSELEDDKKAIDTLRGCL